MERLSLGCERAAEKLSDGIYLSAALKHVDTPDAAMEKSRLTRSSDHGWLQRRITRVGNERLMSARLQRRVVTSAVRR